MKTQGADRTAAVRRIVTPAALAALAASAVLGCSEVAPTTAPVTGLVTYHGKPIRHALVTFLPQSVAKARIGFAQTDENGRFEAVSTFGVGDGAVIGHHYVCITEAWPPGAEIPTWPDGMEKTPPRGAWQNKYRDAASGALQVDVLADRENHFEFELHE